MALLYCFELPYIKKTLDKCKRNDLSVVDTDGCESLVKDAVKRGIPVYINQKLTTLSTIRIAFDL